MGGWPTIAFGWQLWGSTERANRRSLARPGLSGFEQEFGLAPGADVDAETNQTLQEAEEEAKLLHAEAPPPPPPGVRPGSAQYRVYREEVHQSLNIRINRMKHDLRDYYEQKRKENETLAKEAMGVTLPPKPIATSA